MKKAVNILLVLYLVFFNISTLYASQSPVISATSAIVMDAQTGFILYEKDIHAAKYPASIAKIMTALLALEQYGSKLDEPVTFSHNAVFSIPANSSHIAMNEGESITMEDALYGIMLASANEVSNAIAEHIGGDIESFAELMTRRAAALGASNSNFKNPSGLHDAEQVTTAYDMALITREALRHPKFKELISAVRHDIPATEKQPLVRELLNSNRMIRQGQHYNERVVGGKTGFTNPARHTLVTYAEQDGRQLIVVTLDGEGNRLYTDTTELLEYAFAIPYEQQQILSQDQFVQAVPVFSDWSRQRTQVGEARLVVTENVYLELPIGVDVSQLDKEIIAPGQLVMPIAAGDTIGRLSYSIKGRRLGEVELKASNTIVPPADVQEEVAEEDLESVVVPAAPPVYSQEYTFNPQQFFQLELLEEYYYLSVVLPLAVFFIGLFISISIFRLHRNRRQAKLGHYHVIGSHIYRR